MIDIVRSKTQRGWLIVSAIVLATFPARAASEALADETYAITSVMEILPPANPRDMQDDFQRARVLYRNGECYGLEITLHPFRSMRVGETANWRVDQPEMVRYLRPTPTENWDERMKTELIRQLESVGIYIESLTDKQVVEQVAHWAVRRATSTGAFIAWTLYYPARRPEVFPSLNRAFAEEIDSTGLEAEQAICREVVGRSMFYGKVHGSCTSVAIYLATILRAVGIPTRVVICIPPFDPNDGNQAKTFYAGIHDDRVRGAVKDGLRGAEGFVDHIFNEVFVGGRWVRLDYMKLGQPVLEPSRLGLMVHIATFDSLSEAPLAQTWGMRFYSYPAGQPRLSSINPYRLVSVRDSGPIRSH